MQWDSVSNAPLMTCFMGKVFVRSLSSMANEWNAPKSGCFNFFSSWVITAPLFCSAPVPDAVTMAPIGINSAGRRDIHS